MKSQKPVQSDPRLLKGKDIEVKMERPVDPRTTTTPPVVVKQERPVDPRLKRSVTDQQISSDGNKPFDPRVQRTSSEPGDINKNIDPRLRVQTNPPSGVHSLPVKALDPRLARQGDQTGPVSRNMDPRFARQISQENVSKSFDPRLGRTAQGSLSPNFEGGDPRVGNQGEILDRNQDLRPSQLDPRQLNRQISNSNDPRQMNRQNSLGDPRVKNIPPLATDPTTLNVPKLLDPRVSELQNEEVTNKSNVNRQLSQPSTDTEKTSAESNSEPKKLDYRNDPRFKRKIKPSSDSSSSTVQKRNTGQRKGSMEYSSPLGMDSDNQDSSVSGYNSYNRPPPNTNIKSEPRTTQNSSVTSNSNLTSTTNSVSSSPSTTTATSIIDKLSIPELPEFIPPPPQVEMKDFFKTMDPTASPFC